MSVTDIISEQFDEVKIRVNKDNGYICASDLCKAGCKRWPDYKRLDGTREFIQELESVVQMTTTQLIISKRGGTSSQQGTWVHPKIALDLARWISPKIALFIYDIFERYASGDITLIKEVVDKHDMYKDVASDIKFVQNPYGRGHSIMTHEMYQTENGVSTSSELIEKYHDQLSRCELLEGTARGLLVQNKSLRQQNIEVKARKNRYVALLHRRAENIKKHQATIQQSQDDLKKVQSIVEQKDQEINELNKKIAKMQKVMVEMHKVINKISGDTKTTTSNTASMTNRIVIFKDTSGVRAETYYVTKCTDTDEVVKIKSKKGHCLKVAYCIGGCNMMGAWKAFKTKYSSNITYSKGWFNIINMQESVMMESIAEEETW